MSVKNKDVQEIYYTIEYDIENIYVEDPYLTGNKTVRIYKCVDNKITKIRMLDLLLEDNSEQEIKEYLEGKGYTNFKLTQL